MFHKINSFFRVSFIYLIFSLTLLFAFTKYLLPEGSIIAGHDSGLALDSRTFLETRFFAWDERINFGQDNSLLFGSLTIHALDYFFSILSGTNFAGNQLNLFFWLAFIFVSAFIFGYQLRGKLGKNFVFIFPILILFNFYIFQSLFILERAKYSLVAGSLLLLAIIVKLMEQKISIVTASVISALIFSLFNGGSWLGLPLFGGLLIIVSVLFIFLVVADLRQGNLQKSIKFLSFLSLTGIFFLFINSYSLLPYLQTFLKKDYLIIQSSSILDSNKAWLDYISQGSSFLNIFRMQGVPDWYLTKSAPSQTHPFAFFYLQSPLFIALSFLIPVAAFASLVLAKNSEQKKIINLSALIALASMLLMSGTRSPLGFIYEFLFQNVPGFVIFRSSYYKFGYAFFIAYSVLLSFTFSSLIGYVTSKISYKSLQKTIGALLTVLTIFLWLLYHQKLLGEDIFKWRPGSSTKLQVPPYINEYRDYLENHNITNGRTLILPKLHEVWLSDGYDFGYWSLSTIHYSLTKKPVLVNDSNLTKAERSWVDLLYQAIEDRDAEGTQDLISRLGVSKVLLKHDALKEGDWSGGKSPEIYQEIIESFDFLEKEDQFGKWVLYKVKPTAPSLFFAENNLTELTNNGIDQAWSFLGDTSAYQKDDASNKNDFNNFITQRIDSFKCNSCYIEDPVIAQPLPWPRILPNSILFNIKILYENYKLNTITDENEKTTAYLGLVIKRAGETDAILHYRIHEAYIVGNLKLMIGYLDEIIKLTKDQYNPSEDFESAKNLLDNLQSVELKLEEQVSADKIGTRSEIIQDEVFKALLRIYELKKFYSPILENQERWENEKLFDIEIPSAKQYNLYLNGNSLPDGLKAKKGLSRVVINGEGIDIDTNLETNQSWMRLPSEKLTPGKNKVTLIFQKQNSLFIQEGSATVETPEGIKNCHQGRINSQDLGKQYSLKIKTDQPLRIFPKNGEGDEFGAFLTWKNAIFVEGRYSENYFKHQFISSGPASNRTFYICGQDLALPPFKEFIIEQVYDPEIVGIEKFEVIPLPLPDVKYQRLDPANFEVSIKSPSGPFILVMNQRYSPLWSLKDRKSGKKIDAVSLPVDLYAMGWVIDSKADLDLKVFYEPQEYFNKGMLISLGTLVVLLALLTKNLLKGR